MKRKELEEGARSAFAKITPAYSEQLRARCRRKEGTIMKEKTVRKRGALAVLVAAVLFTVLLFGSLLGVSLLLAEEDAPAEPVATVYVDVNPGFEIQVDKEKQVLALRGVGKEGSALLEGMRFEETDFESTLQALSAQLKKEGYLEGINPKILLSVKSADEQAAQELIVAAKNSLKEQAQNAGVVTQKVTSARAQELAQLYDITQGKAQYMIRLIGYDPAYSEEALSKMSIKELSNLCGELNLIAYGQVNLSYPDALNRAFEDAGVDPDKAEILYHHNDAFLQDGEDIFKNAQVFWKIAFRYNERDYIYHFNATTDTISFSDNHPRLMNEQEVTEAAARYLEEKGETVQEDLFVGANYADLYYGDGERAVEPTMTVTASTEKGIYILDVNALTGTIVEKVFHATST